MKKPQTKGRMLLDSVRKDGHEDGEVESGPYRNLLYLLTAWLDKSALRSRT